MKEKDFQKLFKHNNILQGVFELKLCKGTSLPFSALAEHQEAALLAASGREGFYWKIPDNPIYPGKRTRYHSKKPFDCFNLKGEDAYVVIMFYAPRKYKRVYYIPIWDFTYLRDTVSRKSITEDMACDVCAWLAEGWKLPKKGKTT